MSEFNFICKEIRTGKSVIRAYLNYRLQKETLKGKTIDIGGGAGEKYLTFMKRGQETTFETFDLKAGNKVDFETDRLLAEDGAYDTVLFLNVLEHIFNYQHITNEVMRVTKPGTGQLIGFVPFLMWYHPDHRDFFRYTHEALEIILKQAGAKEIKIEPIGKGPFTAAVQMIMLLMPRFLRPILFTISFCLDKLFVYLGGKNSGKYALGYLFIVGK